jgi:hypothetical protein
MPQHMGALGAAIIAAERAGSDQSEA